MSDFHTLGKPWGEVELSDFTMHRQKAAGKHPRVPLPTGSGVYALLDAKRRPLYIGMASMIDRRVCQHWYPHWHVSFFSCNESLARLIERRLIAKHQPRFNTLLTGRPNRSLASANRIGGQP